MNYTIRNLRIKGSYSLSGLISKITSNGSVRNLEIVNSDLNIVNNTTLPGWKYSIGVLAGENYGTIENCMVSEG